MAAELAGLNRSFLASIHREASAFYIPHCWCNIVDGRLKLDPWASFLFYRDKTFNKLDHNFLLLKEYQSYM